MKNKTKILIFWHLPCMIAIANSHELQTNNDVFMTFRQDREALRKGTEAFHTVSRLTATEQSRPIAQNDRSCEAC